MVLGYNYIQEIKQSKDARVDLERHELTYKNIHHQLQVIVADTL